MNTEMETNNSWTARLAKMQTAPNDEEAFIQQYQLETSFYPNQCLTVEAPQLAASLVQGLPQCTEAGRTATFESLEMIAGGCLQPFGAPEAVVMSTRRALIPDAIDAAVSQIHSDTSPGSASLTAVSLLGILGEFSGVDDQRAIALAVKAYASRGVSQAVQVSNEFPEFDSGGDGNQ